MDVNKTCQLADISRMKNLNPWWQRAESIDRDKEIMQWAKSAARHDPPLRAKIEYDFEPDNTVVYTLRGPRQTGKTTLVKLQIRDLLSQGVCPWNIFYYSFDLVQTLESMARIIEEYLKMSDRTRDKRLRTCLFLDELTSVTEWQRGIKHLVDAGDLHHCTVLVTGSSAIDILRGADALPGRRGRISGPYDHILYPMSFAEFVRLRDGEMAEFLADQGFFQPGFKKIMFANMARGRKTEIQEIFHDRYGDRLDSHFGEYLVCGGTPQVAGQMIERGQIPGHLFDLYARGFQADWDANEADKLNNFCRAVSDNLCSAVTAKTLNDQINLGSLQKAEEYVSLLKHTSLVNVVQRYTERSNKTLSRKNKKIYFNDPFYFHIFNRLPDEAEPFAGAKKFLESAVDRGRLVENVVAGHLVRWAFDNVRNQQSFSSDNCIGYWRGDSTRETDFVLFNVVESAIPIEVKYSKHVRNADLNGLDDFLDVTGTQSGLVLSRSKLAFGDKHTLVPVSLFLMCI